MSILDSVLETLKPTSFATAKKKLKSGDILLASGEGVVSSLIKKATGSVFSHVALILHLEESDQWVVLESVETVGVRCVTLENGYLKNYNDKGKPYNGRLVVARTDELAAKAHDLSKMYKRAFSLLGDAYDHEQIFEIGTRIVAAKIGIHESGKLHPGTKYICSEYVYACFQAIGIKFPFDKDGFIAPKDIADAKDVYPVMQLKT